MNCLEVSSKMTSAARTFAIFLFVVALGYSRGDSVNLTESRLDAQKRQHIMKGLHMDLFDPTNYFSKYPPFSNYTSSTGEQATKPVFIVYHASKVIDMDEKGERISVANYIQVYWFDERLQWDPSRYDQTTELLNVDMNSIWFPKITLQNSITKGDLLEPEHSAKILFTGVVSWSSMVILTTPCEMDTTYFPADSQECMQRFYTEYAQLIQGMAAPESYSRDIGITLFDDSMWKVNRSEDIAISNPTGQSPYVMTVQLTLHRKYRYYMTRILAPVSILSSLVLLSFFIPPDAGEKIGFGVTLVLTFSVFQTMIDADLPASSNSTPLLTTAMILLQVCAAMSIVASVIVLNLHHYGSDYEMPRCLKFLFFTVLAKVTFHTHLVKPFLIRNQTIPVQNSCTKIINNGESKIESTESESEIGSGEEWKAAALIVDRLLLFVCLVAMVTVYVSLLSQVRTAYLNQTLNTARDGQDDTESTYKLFTQISPVSIW